MTPENLIVEVRDINLDRVAQLTADDLSGLVVADRRNDVGSWKLTLPDTILDPATGDLVPHAAAKHLRQEGAGIVVSVPGPDIPAVPPTYGPGTVAARNLFDDPEHYSLTTPNGGIARWFRNSGTSAKVTIEADGWLRIYADDATSTDWTAVRATGWGGSGKPVNENTVYTLSVDMETAPLFQDLRLAWWAYTAAGAVIGGERAVLPTRVGSRVHFTFTTPATTGRIAFVLRRNPQAPWAAGDWYRIRHTMLAEGTSTTYFSGATPSDPPSEGGTLYAWEGTPNYSPSTLTPYVMTDPGKPVTPTFETIISGPMTSATYTADEKDLGGRWEFAGVSDAILLADAMAFPSPSIADPDAQAAANDTRTASAEDLIRQYVAYNIAYTHAPAGRLTGFRNRLRLRGSSQGRGPTLTKSPRFQNLLELCQEIAAAGNLTFDIVQAGSYLELVVTSPVDRTKTIRMDMANQLLKSVTYGYGAPSATLPVVAGQGQGAERTMVVGSSADATASETRWGRRIERFFDQRNTDDPAELAQKAAEELANGAATAQGLQAAPADSGTMQYARHWRKGDMVTVVVEGQEVAVPVTEVAVGVDGAAAVIVATLGDPAAFDVDSASQRREGETRSRVSAIERTVEIPIGAGDETAWAEVVGKPDTFPPSAHTHTVADVTGVLPAAQVPTLDIVAKTSGTLPASRVGGADWANISNKPTAYPAAAHTHTASQVTDFATAADARVSASHVAPLTPTGFTLSGGDGGRNPNGLPGAMKIYRWTQPAGGVAVDHFEVWGTQTDTTTPMLIMSSTTTEARIYETPGMWTGMALAVRAVSVNGVPGAFSNAIAYERFDPDLSASTDYKGIVALATSADALAGTDANLAITPATLKAVADTKAASTHGHALTDANITGVLPVAKVPTLDIVAKTSGTLPAARLGAHTHTASQVTDFATAADARVNALVPAASETAQGKVELATVAETTTGTDTTRAVTPAGVKAAIAAIPAETHAGTGAYSVALGVGALANQPDAVAIGDEARGLGSGATALGWYASATGANSTALGGEALATHNGSTAVGTGAATTKDHQIVLGTAADEVLIPGQLAGLPFRMASGSVKSPGGGGASAPVYWDAAVTVTLPVGRFTVPPIVTAVSDAGSTGGVAVGCTITNVSATQFTIRQNRIGSSPLGFEAHWHATQMTSGAAAG